jgi:hypothetical protein
MRFERSVILLIYMAVHRILQMIGYNFEIRTNAKLLNPQNGEENLQIEVKMKKKPDGITNKRSRPDCELELPDLGIWIVIDAKFYNSTKCPKTDEIIKDMKCR